MMLVLTFCLIFFVLFLINRYCFNFWKRKNIPQANGSTFLFGNASSMFTGRQSIGELFQNIYQKYKHEKIIGAYLSYRPVLVINDPELIQDIMITNFASFHDRAMPINEKADPLTANLFFLKGQKWRDLRVKMSPTFSSGKLKAMFSIMKDCGIVLQDHIDDNLKKYKNVFEFRDLLSRFTINIISSVAFGVENDCINEPGNAFHRMGLKIFDQGLVQAVKNVLALLTPAFFVKLNIKLIPSDVYDFIISLVSETIEFREKNNFHRNDFMQLLIQLKNQGYVPVDKNSNDDDEFEWNDEINKNVQHKKLSMDDIAAQVFIFFAAGFETSSSTMKFCLYELCKNLNIQRKLQDEIDCVMKKAGPEGITYELLNEMKYLDCCIDETLRKYPIVPVHFREATKDYQIPGSNLVIEKGQAVHIPLLGLMRDPDVYDEPLTFKPERFINSPTGSPKKTAGIIYSPFGDGSRKCIGVRMGKIQAKLGIFMLMQKFNVRFTDQNLGRKEVTFHPGMLVLTPNENFLFKVTRR